MDYRNGLNNIEETLARGKSIVKESIDLTKKNAERKKEIEKKLHQYFTVNSSKHEEGSFTLELETGHFSMISKGKTQENSSLVDDLVKGLNKKIEDLDKDKNNTQKKLEEYQDLLKDLESENYSNKVKVKELANQVKLYEQEIKKLNETVQQFREENERIIRENQEMVWKYEKVLKENLLFKETSAKKIEKIEKINKETNEKIKHIKGHYSISHRNKPLEDEEKLEPQSSIESYYQFFRNLKKEIFEHPKDRKTPLFESPKKHPPEEKDTSWVDNKSSKANKSEIFNRDQKTNEEIIEKLEANYKKTAEKIKKISNKILTQQTSDKKRLSMSFDDIKRLNSKNPRSKAPVPKPKKSQKKTAKPKKKF